MWNRARSMATAMVALVSFMVGGAKVFAQPQLIASFENNYSSTVGASFIGPALVNSKFVTTGVTEGNFALSIDHATNWTAQLELHAGLPLAQGAATHDFLLIDITTTDSGVAGDGWAPSWRQAFVVFNSNQGNWQQKQIDYHVAADDGGSLTETLVLDLNEVLAGTNSVKANAQQFVTSGGPEGSYFQLILAMQGGDQGTPIKLGDYSPADNIVNAADYVAWRMNEGGTSLPNESATPGSVDIEDYYVWRGLFNKDYAKINAIVDNIRFASAGAWNGSLSASSVPEPSSVAMVFVAALALTGFCRKRF